MAPQNANGDKGVLPLIINNEDVVTDNLFEIRNPSTGELAHQCVGASVEDANRVAAAAKAAFPGWSKTHPNERRAIMNKAADIMFSRKEEFIKTQSEETGAGRFFAEKTFMMSVAVIRDFAGMLPSVEGKSPVLNDEDQGVLVMKQPYGVVLGIAPWNAPFILGVRSVVIPMAAGNTTILKGSELSPKCFWLIGDVFRQAGLPAGVLNVIYHKTSDASAVTNALIASPAVRKINFTGSTNVGAIVAATAGKYVKPVLLELGGKASAIVLDDADLEKAAHNCVLGAFAHSGQVCMSTERIIVQRPIAEKFQKKLAESAEKTFGKHVPAPVLVNAGGVKKNKELVANALEKGANTVFGDPQASESCPNSMRPIVLGGVTKEMDIYATESFGPTVSLLVVDTEEEALQIANDTEYGLTSAVFTTNLFRGLRVAKQIETGAVHINSMTIHDEPTLPHGGWKSSGYGRFGGTTGYDEWLQTKTITWVE
ncbi:Aldehyde/histidinol dehydrogenase [Aspergillus unguis]